MISKAFGFVELHQCSPLLSPPSDAKVRPHGRSSFTQSVLYRWLMHFLIMLGIQCEEEQPVFSCWASLSSRFDQGALSVWITPNELSACSIQCFFDTFFVLWMKKADHTLISNGEQDHLLYFMPYSLFVMNIYICWSLLRCIKIPHWKPCLPSNLSSGLLDPPARTYTVTMTPDHLHRPPPPPGACCHCIGLHLFLLWDFWVLQSFKNLHRKWIL